MTGSLINIKEFFSEIVACEHQCLVLLNVPSNNLISALGLL